MSEEEINSKIEEWESGLNGALKPKLKYPVKITGLDLEDVNTEFSDPSIDPPKEKNKKQSPHSVRVVDISNRKKNDKKKLF